MPCSGAPQGINFACSARVLLNLLSFELCVVTLFVDNLSHIISNVYLIPNSSWRGFMVQISHNQNIATEECFPRKKIIIGQSFKLASDNEISKQLFLTIALNIPFRPWTS